MKNFSKLISLTSLSGFALALGACADHVDHIEGQQDYRTSRLEARQDRYDARYEGRRERREIRSDRADARYRGW